jgi:tellurite resistance protein TerC
MHVPFWVGALTISALVAMLVGAVRRTRVRPAPTLRRSALRSLAYGGVVVALGLLALWFYGGESPGGYLAGHLVEASSAETSGEGGRVVLPVWFEISTFVGLTVLLLADLAIVARRPHEPSVKEASLWVTFYVALAMVFGVVLLVVTNGELATEFYAGWLTEYSLSIDNLFVFVIIMARFQVPRKLQQNALMVGIIVALVLRGIFIVLGAAVIERFTWVFYIFGVFLIYTAINLVRHRGEDEDYEENAFIRQMRKVLPMTPEFHGTKLRVRHEGKKLWTPMIVVFLALGTTDLLFALDSIPAIFGLTREPFIVFTANVFALMGLRQLYFLLGGLLKRLVYLSLGLAVILAFIGVKLVLEAAHENSLPFINGGDPIAGVPTIPIWLSLTVILGVLVVATVASLVKTGGQMPADTRPAVDEGTAATVGPAGVEGPAESEAHVAEAHVAEAHVAEETGEDRQSR